MIKRQNLHLRKFRQRDMYSADEKSGVNTERNFDSRTFV